MFPIRKIYLLIIYSVFFTFVNACSLPSGNLIPVAQDGAELSNSFISNEKDTIQARTGDLRIKMLGRWKSEGEIRLFIEVENTGPKSLEIDLSKVELLGVKIAKSELNSITEQQRLLEQSEPNDRQIYYGGVAEQRRFGSGKVFVKPSETKNLVYILLLFKNDNGFIGNDEIIEVKFPLSEAGKQNNLMFKFKCVLSSDLEYIQHGEPRKQN